MLASDLLEVICCAHLSSYVEGPFPERGGLMLVGPPGAMKSTFLDVLDGQYHDAVTMSDINARGLVDLRDQISNGAIKTIVLPELAKVYERNESTAKNVEGTLRAMTAEGFQAASFEDQRISRLRARAMVIAGMTPSTQEKNFKAWEDSGFNRRFLWSLVRLDDPEVLVRAVMNWRKLPFQVEHMPRAPLTGSIPYRVTQEQLQRFRGWIKYQPGGSNALHMQMICKIFCVMHWWYKQVSPERSAMDTLARFAVSLGRHGDTIIVPEGEAPSPQQKAAYTRKAKQQVLSAAAKALATARRKPKRAIARKLAKASRAAWKETRRVRKAAKK